ncbi:MAG: hypothetical protein OEY05_00380 [Paracoccaceae bacterium]|nr:hypothetical protein [Paracoccaceae bacterium]MDH5528465.1 hypothetical protein [Paracoccaceae bacterium]
MARKTSKRPAAKTAKKPAVTAAKKVAHKQTRDTGNLPALGRMMLWVDRPGSANKIFWGLAVLCGVLFLLDFTYEKHGHFDVEHLPGFFGIYGFVMFTGLILAAKTLRIFIKRPEDYYGDKAIDREVYPEDQLDKVKYNA